MHVNIESNEYMFLRSWPTAVNETQQVLYLIVHIIIN